MKMTHKTIDVNRVNYLNVCSDVHKERLFFTARCGSFEFADICLNRSRQVESQLREFKKVADENGKNMRVVCEPTGEYDRVLLRTAHRMGLPTAYVNTENVVRYRQIESNDSGKTDTKDPRVICSLADQNKVMPIRELDEQYLTLRKLGSIAEDEEVNIVRVKGQLHRELFNLFCDYDFKKDFLYTKSGQALVQLYHCSPYRIIKFGFKRFEKKMKTHVKGIRKTTIQRLWSSAQASILHQLPDCYIEICEQRIFQLYSDYERYQQRKDKIEEEMIKILQILRENDPKLPQPTPHLISEKNLAKLLAETGPLGDFSSIRQLFRYGGLNLRERESGQYKGKTKVAKKGRSRLRKVLGNIVLPLVPGHKLYGGFYHHKKDVDKMPGNKAMMVTMRNFLRKYWGWYKAGGSQFDATRWFTCESQREKTA